MCINWRLYICTLSLNTVSWLFSLDRVIDFYRAFRLDSQFAPTITIPELARTSRIRTRERALLVHHVSAVTISALADM